MIEFKQCNLCKSICITCYKVTELDEKDWSEYYVCLDCVNSFLDMKKSPMHQTVDACNCGMTEETIDKHGKFGCDKCFSHFKDLALNYIVSFHGANKHIGKHPKNNKLEKLKVLKLKLAKALELEKFEEVEAIKKEINQLHPETS